MLRSNRAERIESAYFYSLSSFLLEVSTNFVPRTNKEYFIRVFFACAVHKGTGAKGGRDGDERRRGGPLAYIIDRWPARPTTSSPCQNGCDIRAREFLFLLLSGLAYVTLRIGGEGEGEGGKKEERLARGK